MKLQNYPDGTSYSVIDDLSKKEFTYKINSYEDLWYLGQIVEAFNHNNIKPIVTIPNLIDAQAAKGAWFEVKKEHNCDCVEFDEPCICKPNIKQYNIYKDPITDDGTKKSLKGLCKVDQLSGSHGKSEIFVKTECTEEEENTGLLQTIYEDGKFYNQTTFEEIRNRLKF